MPGFPKFFGKGKFLSRKLKLCAEARASGEFDTVRELAEEALKAIPESQAEKYVSQRRSLLLALAEAAFRDEHPDVARDALSQAISLSEGNRDFVSVLTDFADVMGEDAVPLLKQGIKESSQEIKLLKALARIYEGAKRDDTEADKLYKLILTKDPEYPPALLGIARSALRLKHFTKDMLTPLRLAFRHAPNDRDILKALSLTYSAMPQPPEESLGVLKTAFKEFPDEPSLFSGLTKIYITTPGYDEEKVHHLKRAFSQTGTGEIAQVLLPYLLKSRSRDEISLKIYEISWRDHDQKSTMLSYLAEAYQKENRRDESAVKVFEELFNIFPHLTENTVFLANVYADDGVTDRTAEIVYERAFKDDPSKVSPQVVKLLSRCYLNAGREDNLAKMIFDHQLKNDPEDVKVMIALGEMGMEREHLSGEDVILLKALFHHKEVQRKLTEDIAKRLGEHLALSGAGDAEAIEIYEFNYSGGVASEAEENLLAAHYARKGLAAPKYRRLFEAVYSRTSDKDVLKALTGIYVDLKEVDEQAIDIFIAHLKKHPTDKKVLGLVCPYLLKRRGDDPATYPFIVEALKLDPKLEFIGMKKGDIFNALIHIGRHFIKTSQFAMALDLFKAAYTREEHDIIQYLLGISYLAGGDINTAGSIFDNLRKKDPENPLYLYRTGAVTMAQGNTKKARSILEILQAKYNGHPLALLRLGMLAELEGKDDEALEHYGKAHSTNTEINALAKARKGIVLLRLQRSDEAIETLEEARRELGNGEDIIHGLAGAYAYRILSSVDANDNDAAWRAVDKMLGLGLKEMSFIEMVGRLAYLVNLKLLISGNARKSLEGVKTMLGTIPEQPGSLYLGGLIEHFNRRFKPAQEYINTALDMGRRLGPFEPPVQLLSALNLIRLKRYFEANEHLEWLYDQQHRLEEAFILRIISFYQNDRERGYPSFLKGQDYGALKDRLKLSLGFMGSLFLKGGEFNSGVTFFEKIYKELETKQDKLEADFFLGLFHIKSRKEKVGLHYWRNIINIKENGDLQADIVNQIHFSLFLHFLDNYFVPEAQTALKRIKPNGDIDLNAVTLFLYLQKGYIEAKSNNFDAACREWEHGLSIHPSNWMLNQNLALAKTIMKKEDEAVNHFNVLIHELERGGEEVFGTTFTFMFEESRKVYNHLVSFRSGNAQQQVEAKRDIIQDNITSANRAYWSLNLRKGDTFKEAEVNYFRLIKIYNPERYPDEFKEIEAAYAFFKKEGHLRKNEQLVFNSFDLKRFIEMGGEFVQSEIPDFPSVRRFVNEFTRPARFFDLSNEVKLARDAVAEINPDIPGPEYTINDWLMDW